MARLLVLIAAVGLLALPAAPLAATRSDGTLSVKRAKGHIQIKLRGTVIGSMANGSVRIRDLTPNDGQYATFRHCRERIVSLTTSVCKGKKLSFRALDGALRRHDQRERHLPLRGRPRHSARSTARATERRRRA